MAEANNTDQNRETREIQMETWRTCRDVSELIQGREKALDRYGREVATLFLLYLAAKMKDKNGGKLVDNGGESVDISEPKTFLQECFKQELLKNGDLLNIVDELFDTKEWEKIKKQFTEYARMRTVSPEGVAREILERSFYISSSPILISLVNKILMEDIPEDRDTSILDIGSGDGTFLATLSDPAADGRRRRLRYLGLDKNEMIQKVAKIRAEVVTQDLSQREAPLFGDIDFIPADCRCLSEEQQTQYRCDRVFVDLGRDGRRPWDDEVTPVRRRTAEEKVTSYTEFKNLKNDVNLSLFGEKKERLYESEWYAALIAMNLLSEKEGNKAVMTMSISALCGVAPADTFFRQNFVYLGWVQQVILLPRPMQRFSRGRECLVVFSRGNNENKVRMIDARNFYEESRWGIRTAPDFVERIAGTDIKEGICRDVANGEINEDTDYSLYPVEYLMRVEGKSLKDLATITRGKDLPRSKLRRPDDTHQTEEDAAKQREGLRKNYYLSISDIDSGFLEITGETIRVPGDENSLKEMGIDPSNDYLKAGDLLLGKMLDGIRFRLLPQARVAVIEEEDLKDENGNERRLIAGSNLFVFRKPTGLFDKEEDKFLPYFIKAFLESDACRGQLELAAAGSALSSISIGSLKKIKVPESMRDRDEKRNEDYAEMYKQLRDLRKRLKTLTDETKGRFDKDLEESLKPHAPAVQDNKADQDN